MAAALFGKLASEFLLLLFEIVEFHFHESTMIHFMAQGVEELGADAFLTNLERGLEPLGLGLLIADLGVGEPIHLENVGLLVGQCSLDGLSQFCGVGLRPSTKSSDDLAISPDEKLSEIPPYPSRKGGVFARQNRI
jgi:hypothetical protein